MHLSTAFVCFHEIAVKDLKSLLLLLLLLSLVNYEGQNVEAIMLVAHNYQLTDKRKNEVAHMLS
jgi:hypothetical protein